jgi:hypothetical protein
MEEGWTLGGNNFPYLRLSRRGGILLMRTHSIMPFFIMELRVLLAERLQHWARLGRTATRPLSE